VKKSRSSDQSFSRPGKLVECHKGTKHREIFLVEGDSAGGSAKLARNPNQAVLPLKGKVINAEKGTIERALDNTEIESLISVIGAGVDIPGTDL